MHRLPKRALRNVAGRHAIPGLRQRQPFLHARSTAKTKPARIVLVGAFFRDIGGRKVIQISRLKAREKMGEMGRGRSATAQ